MNPFVYTDIFDTKGIEYLIVIAFLLILIPYWTWLNRPKSSRAAVRETSGALTRKNLRILPGLFYSRNHTWSQLEPSGLARIGADDLLLHLTGGVQVEFFREEGARVRKGEDLIRIHQNGKELVLPSPISGTLARLNPTAVGTEPEGGDPYATWLCMVRPDDWQGETADCYLGDIATDWMAHELTRFKDFVAEAMPGKGAQGQAVLQEGGELTDFPLAGLDKGIWELFQDKFLDHPRC